MRPVLKLDQDVQTEKVVYSDKEDHIVIIEEDHRRRLRDMLIEGVAEFNSRMNNITMDPRETVSNLVNVVFDCRSLYEMNTDEYSTAYDKLALLKIEIIDWVVKLVCREDEVFAAGSNRRKVSIVDGSFRKKSKKQGGIRRS